ncbi:MAG: hypothetical protein AAF571_10325 [Verrucomicrobiota bacterium]
MRDHDTAEDVLASYEAHPADHIEPEAPEMTDYREASLKMLTILERAMDHILYYEGNKEVASWQVAFAMGLDCCEGKEITSVANNIGVERATISKGATEFCRANDLPPSRYMKSEEATKSYREAREAQLTTSKK